MGYFESLYASELPHRAVAVYMYLRDRADKDGKCYPAIGTIAAELKPSRSTVKEPSQTLKRAVTFARSSGGVRMGQEQQHIFLKSGMG